MLYSNLFCLPTNTQDTSSVFDYDTVVTGVMIAINAMLGLPVLVAATVRSLNHVHAMAEKSPEGKILSVQEPRLTHLCFVWRHFLPWAYSSWFPCRSLCKWYLYYHSSTFFVNWSLADQDFFLAFSIAGRILFMGFWSRWEPIHSGIVS